MANKAVWLDLLTYQGVHYQVSAWRGRKRVKVTCCLSQHEATRLNKADGVMLAETGAYHRKGEWTGRFLGEEMALQHGIRVARKTWSDANIIFRGDPFTPREIVWSRDPQPALVEIYKADEALREESYDPWAAGRGDEAESLERRWSEAVR